MTAERFRILVVDDEPLNIEVVGAILQEEYDLDTAHGGYEAISMVKRRMPDLVLLDVMMPDLDGFEVCRILKADPALAHIPIVFMTVLDTLDAEMKGLEAGGIDYLTKPLHLGLVKLRVRNHIELVRRSRLLQEQRNLLASQNEELETALARVRTLEGIIPICMYCKGIRSNDNIWHQLEGYISRHSDALFSHAICPACLDKQLHELKD